MYLRSTGPPTPDMTPYFTRHAETGEFRRFPDTSAGDETSYDYFTADFNFLAVPGKLLVGAA